MVEALIVSGGPRGHEYLPDTRQVMANIRVGIDKFGHWTQPPGSRHCEATIPEVSWIGWYGPLPPQRRRSRPHPRSANLLRILRWNTTSSSAVRARLSLEPGRMTSPCQQTEIDVRSSPTELMRMSLGEPHPVSVISTASTLGQRLAAPVSDHMHCKVAESPLVVAT